MAMIDAGSIAALSPNETFTLYYDLNSALGQHENTAKVEGLSAISATKSSDMDDANYFVLPEGPGVRTPGFWQGKNNGALFWDGINGNSKTGDGFTENGDLLIYGNTSGKSVDDPPLSLPPNGDAPATAIREGDDPATIGIVEGDANGDGVVTSADKGLLIGDYNRNGVQDGTEDTLFISFKDAQDLVNVAGNPSNGTLKLGRDVVATWLNYLAGNNIGDASDDEQPAAFHRRCDRLVPAMGRQGCHSR